MSTRTIKTTIHTYHFNTRNPTEASAYEALSAELSKTRECFNVIGDQKGNTHGYGPIESGKVGESAEIELETNCLFNNQWNEASTPERKSWRVFDWYEGIWTNRAIKSGHWLEITDEMRSIRQSTLKCGYCGKHYPDMEGKTGFCSACLGSEYLKSTDLALIQLLPVSSDHKVRREITEEQKAEIMPLYIEAQTKCNSERAKAKREKERVNIEREYREWKEKVDHEMEQHQIKYRGFTWLWEHEISTENCIYYSHTEQFCFGWHGDGVSPEVKSRLLEILTEFPYSYEIKCTTDNKTDNRRVSAKR